MEDIEGREIIHHEMALGPNSAISLPFRQAVPNVPRINPRYCIHFKTGGCKVCSKVCPKDCIHYDDTEQIEEIDVGAVIMATGFDNFDPTPMKQYGYGKYPNVITAEEFEMMNNAAGPTGGKILLENGEEPRSIAILHCIGSRDENHHKYCSRVCCMYALKFAHLVKEKTSAEVYQLYIDVRSFGKGYEEFYQTDSRRRTSTSFAARRRKLCRRAASAAPRDTCWSAAKTRWSASSARFRSTW